MQVLSGPSAHLALLLRHAITEPGQEKDFLTVSLVFLPLFIFVCLLLGQLILYFLWKLRQAEDELSRLSQDRNAIYRHRYRSTAPRSRSVGSHSHN